MEEKKKETPTQVINIMPPAPQVVTEKEVEKTIQQHQPVPQPKPIEQELPPMPEKTKVAGEKISKRMAANEVLIKLTKLKQLSVASIFFILFAVGVATFEATIATIISAGYVVYAGYTLMKTEQDIKYLKRVYGI